MYLGGGLLAIVSTLLSSWVGLPERKAGMKEEEGARLCASNSHAIPSSTHDSSNKPSHGVEKLWAHAFSFLQHLLSHLSSLSEVNIC